MEWARAGEALLLRTPLFRSTATRLPSRRPAESIARTIAQGQTITSLRAFSASSQCKSTDQTPSNALADGSPSTPTSTSSLAELSNRVDELWKGSSSSQKAHSPLPYMRRGGSSADMLRSAYANRSGGSREPFGSAFSPVGGRGRSNLDVSQMRTPVLATGHFNDLELPYSPQQSQRIQMQYPTLNSSTGRTVTFKSGMDFARGMKLLDALTTRNRVKMDLNRQRFHERPGLKRKRLKSERWRRRFKEGFRDIVDRVERLTKQGW